MNVGELVRILPEKDLRGDPATEITGLAYHSGAVRPGFLFACWRGLKFDGHDFAPEAVRRGARALLVERGVDLPPGVVQVLVPSSRRALALVAATFWGHPSRRLRLVGVTGTNGKTTTTYLIRHILAACGHRVGLMGTVRNVVCDRELPVERTTPESVDIMALLAQMVECGSAYCSMEVSSHALDQERVAGCEFAVAVFTNLTQDHLDYHPTFADYLEAKLGLFRSLGRGYLGSTTGKKLAAVNTDDASYPRFAGEARRAGAGVVSYGMHPPADVTAAGVRMSAEGTSFLVRTPAGEAPVSLPLVGRFNVYNALAALAVAVGEGVPLALAVRALAEAPQVPGRFERIREAREFSVIVDYAHTPDGLRNVLETAREITPGRVIAVFGCGGDRDRGKRPIMGRIARELADVTVITSDNPRSEDPRAIIGEIEEGVRAPGYRYLLEPDRRRAISLALAEAAPGDLVLVAGKGHETYQVIGDRTLPFDDRQVVRELLAGR
ncbi:MAG: UDP-N-acetylmuramoyl-L-alanyl-D-glutamate--2,6-diaminopimelate ligase [Bacillota bacterium]|nr:UDP-N-acetylmuramoyl-L-alanyl-D-glutamate--2,6-diaminopimelate ligase [Bacillota bacterium]